MWRYASNNVSINVTGCTLFMVLFLCRMCRCGLHAGLWSHIGSPMCLLACRTSQYSRTFIPFSVSLWKDLSDPRFRWGGIGGFQEQGQCLFIGTAPRSLFVSSCFPFLFLHSMGWYCGAGARPTDMVLIALSLPCTTNLF